MSKTVLTIPNQGGEGAPLQKSEWEKLRNEVTALRTDLGIKEKITADMNIKLGET